MWKYCIYIVLAVDRGFNRARVKFNKNYDLKKVALATPYKKQLSACESPVRIGPTVSKIMYIIL